MLQVFHMREGPEKLLTHRLIAKALMYRAVRMFRKPSNQAAKVRCFFRLLFPSHHSPLPSMRGRTPKCHS